MASPNTEEPFDDEIFTGKLTLSEIRKRLFMDKQRLTMPSFSKSRTNTNLDESLKLIETLSEPDLVTSSDSTFFDYPTCATPKNCSTLETESDNNDENCDDSLIKIERMVEKFKIASEKKKQPEHSSDSDEGSVTNQFAAMNPPDLLLGCETDSHQLDKDIKTENIKTEYSDDYASIDIPKLELTHTPAVSAESTSYFTPSKHVFHSQPERKLLTTPTSATKVKTQVFKTPLNILLPKKPLNSNSKKPISQIATYKHIASPVACYIRSGPQVSLVTDVRPKKPLPAASAIPKPVSATPRTNLPRNKENINLPSLAYRSAKKTKVIDVPDENKLPKSQWAMKLTSSLPRPMVMRHDRREAKFSKSMAQEDSFADLSLHQAELSVCTKTSALKKS